MKFIAALAAVAAVFDSASPPGAGDTLSADCDACMAPCIESCKVPGGGFNKLCMRGCDSRCQYACARPSAEPAADPWWHCEGHVQACTSPDHEGRHGCQSASGVGPTESAARGDGAYDCQLTLRGQKGGEWTCTDPSGMKCWPNTNAAPQGDPVEGKLNYTCDGEIVCRTKDDAFPCSLTTHEDAATLPQAEEQARTSMTATCASRWGTSADKCSVNSLSCKPTY